MAVKSRQKKSKLRHAEYYDMQTVQDRLHAQSGKGRCFNNLVEIITQPENIKMAYRNLKTNSGSHTAGVDGKTIEDLAKLSHEKLIDTVQRKFRWYAAEPVRRVEIPKPGNPAKKRPLGIPTITDRLIQQCILQVLEPICEAKFHDNSFGFRPNRSQEHAIALAYSDMQICHLHFVVDVDIKGFFDNVSHGKLLKQLWTLGIRDKKLLSILSAMLKAEVAGIGFPDKGTPQGSIISPLLSNVVLNELDWWVASQWENFPTRQDYSRYHKASKKVIDTPKYPRMRKTGLKECRLVRYADDFKIFTTSHEAAEKLYHATKGWLDKRLGLEISEEKSKIVNLRKKYSEFLGFKMKVIKRGKKKNGQPKYVVESHVSDKSIAKIKHNLDRLIHDLEFPGHGKRTEYAAINRYNAYVLGVHNYYHFATRAAEDMRKLAFPVQKSLKTRLGDRVKTARQVKKRKIPCEIPPYIQERYGNSQQLRFVKGHALIPIGYTRYKTVSRKRNGVSFYTPEGREEIHKNLHTIDMRMLYKLMRNPIPYRSIEYNDNRISLYVAQKGKCAVTGEALSIENVHCHHKIPCHMGGKDNYQNLVLVTTAVHRLIHATNAATIGKYMEKLNLDKRQLKRLNDLKTLANTGIVYDTVLVCQ